MRSWLPVAASLALTLATPAPAQSVRTWTSDSSQRWNRNSNWSGSNQPNASNEVAQFGTGAQLNPELNANNLTIRGILFSSGASSYVVGDDNGSRTLKIGNGTSGYIQNNSAANQAISISTLQFQSDATISTNAAGTLTLDSRLTGNNRDLVFDTDADVTVHGNITTGSGTLTKQGNADLHLSGANTYSGQTTVNAGAIVLEASNVFADVNRISLGTNGTLRLNDYSDTIARLSGTGNVDFGTSGAGSLTLGSGTSLFAGSFSGSGQLIIGAGATLVLGADFNNTNLAITLAGGTLQLAGYSLTAGTLNISGNSQIDFGAGAADSQLDVQGVSFTAGTLGLTVTNWADAADFFYSSTGYVQGAAPLDQIGFQGWSTADTKWQSFDHQVTPVPEPGVYGALLLGSLLAVTGARPFCRRGRAN